MIGKILDNRYELEEFIGKGGMALVYRALDLRTGHNVAVKVLRPEFAEDEEFLERFDREAHTASKMSHHNIVNLLDMGQEGELRYIVMEYVNGRTLKEVILQKGALPPTVAAQIAIRILSALQHAHDNGIIHRDIKSQNILVNADGHIKVSDFGIARVAGSNTISKTDNVMGSVHYFSPEQAKGETVSFGSDLYSVGIVIYEMLTGQLPFDGETPVAIAMQQIGAQAKSVMELNPSVQPAFARVVEKAMEKKLDKRYHNATEMAQDIKRALEEPDGTWLGRLPDKEVQSNGKVTDTTYTFTTTAMNIPVKKEKKTAILKWIGVLALAVLTMMIIVGGSMLFYEKVINIAEVPYVVDETLESARRNMEKAGLQIIIERTSDEIKPLGTVISQNPEYGTAMKKDEYVTLTVSTGPKMQAAPSILDLSREEAEAKLSEYGFKMFTLSKKLSAKPYDTVISQQPEEGTLMENGSVVEVILSGGSVKLPNLIGMTQEEAMSVIRQQGLELEAVIEVQVSDVGQTGRVAAQKFVAYENNEPVEYLAGQEVMQQTKVTLAIYVLENSSVATETPMPTQQTEELGL